MIVLRAKNVEFEVTHITADNKPDWFLEVSPHGKVPLLMVDQEVLFESNAIVEFWMRQLNPGYILKTPLNELRIGRGRTLSQVLLSH